MTSDTGRRFMDEHMPDIQQHFDLQLQAIRADMAAGRADMAAMRAGQDALGARVEVLNSHTAVADNRQIEILEHVKKQNGRVTDLENWQHFQQGKAEGSGSAGRVLIAVFGVAGTLVGGAVGILALVLRG